MRLFWVMEKECKVIRGWKKLIVVAAAVLAGAACAIAQTDAQFSQYYEVPTVYNPSALGLTDFIKIRAGGRMQWVGIDNAPTTFLLTGDMPMKIGSKRIGLGAVVETESMGLYNSLQVGVQGAYKFRKFGGEFSVGFQLGMYDQRFKGSEVFIPDDDDYHDSTDNGIPQRDIHGTAFDMNLGLWYNHPKFWAGLSCTHLTSPVITMKDENEGENDTGQVYEFQANRTLYFMAGCNIPIKNSLIELLPSVLVKSDFTFTTGEATLRARYNKMFSLGIGYRYDDAVYIALGAELKNFYLGYTYDYSTSAIAKASSGSHEVFLGYRLKLDLSDKNKNKHKSIRIM